MSAPKAGSPDYQVTPSHTVPPALVHGVKGSDLPPGPRHLVLQQKHRRRGLGLSADGSSVAEEEGAKLPNGCRATHREKGKGQPMDMVGPATSNYIPAARHRHRQGRTPLQGTSAHQTSCRPEETWTGRTARVERRRLWAWESSARHRQVQPGQRVPREGHSEAARRSGTPRSVGNPRDVGLILCKTNMSLGHAQPGARSGANQAPLSPGRAGVRQACLWKGS